VQHIALHRIDSRMNHHRPGSIEAEVGINSV
jgi:hypothetical protein